MESSKTTDENTNITLPKLQEDVEEEKIEQNNMEPLKRNSEVDGPLTESECVGTTNRKEGCNKESAGQKDECPLDSVSTQKKEEPALNKYPIFDDNDDNINEDENLQVDKENEEKSLQDQLQENSEDSGYQELFANGLDLLQKSNKKQESESEQEDEDEEEEKYIDKVQQDLIDIEETDNVNLSDKQEEPTDEEMGDDAQLGLGLEELKLDAEENDEDLQKSNRNNQLDDIGTTILDISISCKHSFISLDLDNLVEKKIEDDIASRILADHDIDQIEIDRFLTYENERYFSNMHSILNLFILLERFHIQERKSKLIFFQTLMQVRTSPHCAFFSL